jgi:hypothetical protein
MDSRFKTRPDAKPENVMRHFKATMKQTIYISTIIFASRDGGTIPAAVWDTASTLSITSPAVIPAPPMPHCLAGEN